MIVLFFDGCCCRWCSFCARALFWLENFFFLNLSLMSGVERGGCGHCVGLSGYFTYFIHFSANGDLLLTDPLVKSVIEMATVAARPRWGAVEV